MNVDLILIGQGISGTCLSYFLHKEKIPFLIIDNANLNSPSRVAAGIINPVTGRRIVRTWMIEELLAFANQFYEELAATLNIKTISEKQIIDFFPSPQMKIAFDERINEGETYLQKPADENSFFSQFSYDFGYGVISPAYTVHLQHILPAWKNKLKGENLFIDEEFEHSELKLHSDGLQYKNISAKKIIFCDGVQSALSPYFTRLPFAPNKGEMLIVEIPDLSPHYLYKKGMVLAPLAEKNLFWLGSNYLWEFKDENPSPEFYRQSEALLKSWLKLPFKILEHKVSIRPATLERRPFVGFHPVHKHIGILNGMGTKGCTLAPYFAKQLAENIISGKPVLPEADISRFKRVLSA